MADQDPFAELERRCAAVGLTVEEETEEFENTDGTISGQHNGWCISSATGDFARAAILYHPWDVEFALSTSFERFRPIQGYEAMWSPSEGIIEAEIILRPPTFLDEHAFSELLRRLGLSAPNLDPRSIAIPFPAKPGDPTITLRFASPELLIWRTTSPAVHLIDKDSLVPSIRIEGLQLRSEAEAKEQLETLGNAALLELDLRAGVAARLRTHYPWRIRIGASKPKATLQRIEYTPEVVPVSLYMHARLGTYNLAAQFLGFYQALEYFFPRCSISSEIQRLRTEIINESPSFAAVTDADLRLVLERTRLNRGRGVGFEVDQFQHTIKAAVEAAELRTFIGENKGLREFYAKLAPPIVGDRIRVEEGNRDLRQDAAKRLYNIRCRIVHTKEEPDDSVFIPFAAEVAELEPDVQLIRFLAQRTLWAYARPLR
jgi:hypothetical protein